MPANKGALRILRAALVLCGGLARCHTFQPPQEGFTAEAFAHQVFKTFQAKDSAAFMAYAISPAEIDNLPDQPAERSFLKMTKAEIRRALLENRKKMPESFFEIIRLGESEFAEWRRTRYDGAEYLLEKDREIRSADYIDIFFYAGERRYKIRLDDCLLGKRGWVIMDGVLWKGKAELPAPVK